MRRIRWHHLAGYQPIEKHPDRREMLLDRRRRPLRLQRLDIGGHVDGLHLAELADPLPYTPAQKSAGSSRIPPACSCSEC
jgi:hypothetical protein